jgi:hypothetical protein
MANVFPVAVIDVVVEYFGEDILDSTLRVVIMEEASLDVTYMSIGRSKARHRSSGKKQRLHSAVFYIQL